MPKVTWETYEEVAQYLIGQFAHEFRLEHIEGKQSVSGNSGTSWELDAKGVRDYGESIILIECKRYTTKKVSQEIVAGLSFRIMDTNAVGGIIVSPLGLQRGAELVAAHKNIVNVRLDKDSTTTQYIMEFLNNICVGFTDNVSIRESISITIKRADGSFEYHEV